MKNTIRRTFIKMVGLAAAALVCSSCSKSDKDAAADSNTLTIYTALEDDEISVYKKLWEAKHPDIKLNIVRDSTGVMTSKLLAEKDNPKADVVWGLAATSLLVADQNGMLEAYAPAGIESIKPAFKDSKNAEPHWVGIKAWMTGFVCNTKEFEAANLGAYPKSYQDLLDPRFKGQLIMPNPASSGTGYLTVSAVLQSMGEEEGWKYLDQLHNNILRYTHSGSKPAKLAGKGECSVGISFGYRGYKQKKKGEPVKTMFPVEKSGWDLEANALIKKENINPNAKKFLDWAISQELMKEYSKVYPVVASKEITTTVPDEDYPTDPSAQLAKNDFDWAAKNRKRILEEWAKRYDSKSDPKN